MIKVYMIKENLWDKNVQDPKTFKESASFTALHQFSLDFWQNIGNGVLEPQDSYFSHYFMREKTTRAGVCRNKKQIRVMAVPAFIFFTVSLYSTLCVVMYIRL